MPGQPCVNHPNEITFVRCGRCDAPICVRCMVDTPVGKKCRDCSRNRTHLSVSSPRQVALGFLAALAAALVCGAILRAFPFLPILAFPYGYVIAEAALRGGSRSRSGWMQAATGLAALTGTLVTQAIRMPSGLDGDETFGLALGHLLSPWTLAVVVIAVSVAVSRVRYL
jgi:hypothetical protein